MPLDDIDPGLRFLLRFIHPEKKLPPLPGMSEALVARLFGLPEAQYNLIRADIDADTARAARSLADDPEIVAAVDRLALAPGTAIVGLGDSITDDSNGWFEILRRVVTQRRPEAGVSFVNAGVSGETTVEMLARMPVVAAANPAWIICLAGVNNGRRFGAMPGPQFSVEETLSGLRMLRDYAARETQARWLWLTPAGVDEALIEQNAFWRQLQVRFFNADMMATADAMRSLADPVLDLRGEFGDPVDRALLLDDGVHPNIDGQTRIARAVIRMLATI